MNTRKLTDLRQKKEQLHARIKREEQKLKATERKKETRRKILVGAAFLAEAKNDPAQKKVLTKMMEKFLSKQIDRDLFDLPSMAKTSAPSAEDSSP